MTSTPTKTIDGPTGEPLEVPADASFDEIIDAGMRQMFNLPPASVPPSHPTSAILTGDCVHLLDRLDSGSASVVFCDPPYNQGVDYGNGSAADKLPDNEYVDWCRGWIAACRQVLADDGSIWLLISDEYAAELCVAMKQVGLHMRNWIKWRETFGVNCTRKFCRTSRHLLYFVAHPRRFTFNAEQVTVLSDRITKYNDKRANPNGKVMGDVWDDIPRLCGTHKERIEGFPTQLPLNLLRRVIGVSSNPGDLVIDPFTGSGTTGVAAKELGRHFRGIEVNDAYAALAYERIEAVQRVGATT